MDIHIVVPFILFITLLQLASCDVCTDDVCEFDFLIQKIRTMSYSKPIEKFVSRAYNVDMEGHKLKIIPNSLRQNGTDDMIGREVSAADVVTADGYERTVTVINGQFPGPTIEVMEGSEVVVHVQNQMLYEGITIHWHGVYVPHTPFMDGVGYLTQCPIHPRQNFTYRFKAEPAGTHWYHPHFRSLKTNGGYGMILIHKSAPKLPAFPMIVVDWLHEQAETLEVLNPYSVKYRGTGQLMRPRLELGYSIDGVEIGEIAREHYSIIVNGRGRFYQDKLTPYERFEVVTGKEYKFHLINAGSSFAMEISVDGHDLKVVASDGYDIHPVTVTSIMIFHGESIDFTVTANQTTGLYWVRVKTLRVGVGPDVKPDNVTIEGFGVLQYKGTNKTSWEEPTTSPRVCAAKSVCTVFNCPFKGYPDDSHISCVGFDTLTSTLTPTQLDNKFGVTDDEYEEVFLNFNFAIGSCINGRKFVNPTAPLYEGLSNNIIPCSDECDEACMCTHIINLPYNKTIQMVLSNLFPDDTDFDHHPIHMHGHGYAVLKVGYPEFNHSTGHWVEVNKDIVCNDHVCAKAKWKDGMPKDVNTKNPPIKDTLLLPARGYAIIRFRSDNPGFWFMHCHSEQHIMDGMALVLHEGEGHIPPLPNGYPTCINDYVFTEKEYQKYQKDDFTPAKNISGGDHCKDVQMTLDSAVGSAIGFFLIGVAFTLLLVCFYQRCIVGNNRAKFSVNSEQPYSHF